MVAAVTVPATVKSGTDIITAAAVTNCEASSSALASTMALRKKRSLTGSAVPSQEQLTLEPFDQKC